ncbi:MAG: hypothetical protein WAK45_01445 [Methanoregula sp.]
MRKCITCHHKDRTEIDRELIKGIPCRVIAEKYWILYGIELNVY